MEMLVPAGGSGIGSGVSVGSIVIVAVVALQ